MSTCDWNLWYVEMVHRLSKTICPSGGGNLKVTDRLQCPALHITPLCQGLAVIKWATGKGHNLQTVKRSVNVITDLARSPKQKVILHWPLTVKPWAFLPRHRVNRKKKKKKLWETEITLRIKGNEVWASWLTQRDRRMWKSEQPAFWKFSLYWHLLALEVDMPASRHPRISPFGTNTLG